MTLNPKNTTRRKAVGYKALSEEQVRRAMGCPDDVNVAAVDTGYAVDRLAFLCAVTQPQTAEEGRDDAH